MMGEGPVSAAPDADIQTRGGDTAASDLDRADRFSGQRMLDRDRVWVELRADTPDGDVAATIHDEPGVFRESDRDGVRTQAFAGSAGVDHHARRASDRARTIVDHEPAPARGGIGPGCPPRWSMSEGLGQRSRIDTVKRVVIPGPLERPH